MKILFVTDDFLPAVTGVGVYCQQVSKELVSAGHTVSILTSAGTQMALTPKTEMWEKVKICRTRTIVVAGFPQAIPVPSDISRIIADEKPDLIHYHYLSFLAFTVSIIAKNKKIPELMTYHFNPDVLTGPWFMRPFRVPVRAMVNIFLNHINLITSPSLMVKESLEKAGMRTPIIHITNPVTFQINQEIKSLDNKKTPFTIMYAGRLAVEKNIAYLIAAFKEFLKTNPSAILWLAGKGPLEMELRSQCEKLEISSNVVFLGHLPHDELKKHYQQADVFVLPSLEEVLSLVVIEAMSFGKPLIVTDKIISRHELVNSGKNGFIVNSDNVNDLTEKLNQLAANPDLVISMGKDSLEHAKNFRIETIMKKILQSYDHLVKKHV